MILALCACGAGGAGGGELQATPEPGPSAPVTPLATVDPVATVLLPPSATTDIDVASQVVFSGACAAPAGRRMTHAWTFPGGTPVTSASASPGAVTFASEGTYRVTYRCLDDASTSNVAVRTIVVHSPAPVALALAVEPGAAQLREPIRPAPVVQLASGSGLPVQQAGVPISVSLDGAGALAGSTTRVTDAQGRAVFDDVTFIGTAVGDRQLRFSSPNFREVASRSIRVAAGRGAQLSAASSTSQQAREGAAVQVAPAVLVRDLDGNPVPGVPVRFDVVTGGGLLAGSEPFTDAAGVARLGSWTLGTGTQQVLRATLVGLPTAQITFSATAISAATAYDVTLRYLTPLSTAQRAAFENARARIERVVVGDLPEQPLALAANENCSGVAISETVDDLLIAVRVVPIDGVGGTLGRAGPCLVRGGTGGLPALALMEFDSDDLSDLEARGQLQSVVLHEMLHTLGFGTRWAALLVNGGLEDPFFDGKEARAAFMESDGGSGYGGISVPVENSGNPGTRDAHWRESVFGNELMTGWLSGATQPLSRTTVASMQDIGYRVDLAAADSLFAGGVRTMDVGPAPVHVGDDVLSIPVGTVDERGNVTPPR